MTQGQEMTRFGTMVALVAIALFANNAEAGGRKCCGFFGGGSCGFFSSCGKQQNCAPVCHQPVQSGCPTVSYPTGHCLTGNCTVPKTVSYPTGHCLTGNCPVPKTAPTIPASYQAPSPDTIVINGVTYIRQK